MTPELQTLVIVVVNILIGIILIRQIRSQKQVINIYKDLISAVSPEKIVALQKREVEQLNNIYSTDIKDLNIQTYQLARFVVH